MPPSGKSGPSGSADRDALAEFEREFGRKAAAPRPSPPVARAQAPPSGLHSPTTPSAGPRAPVTAARAVPPPPARPGVGRDPAHGELLAHLEDRLARAEEAVNAAKSTAARLAGELESLQNVLARAEARAAAAETERTTLRTELAIAATREKAASIEIEALRANVATLMKSAENLRERRVAPPAVAPVDEEPGALGRAQARFSTACLVRGITRVAFVGGSPPYRKALREGLDPRLELTFVEGDQRRIPKLPATDLVIVWGATELDHTVSEHFPRALYIPHRGITGMLERAAEQIEKG